MASFKLVRGFPCPESEWFTQKNLEDAMDYTPHDDDIIIASYPKTGTTWLQYIVLQIVTKGKEFPTFEDILLKFAPHLEFVGTTAVDKMASPRIYKHHFPYDRVQKNKKAKCLYIHRRPEDTCLSFYHFTKDITKEPMDFDAYFDDFLSGNIGYGNYFENLLSFLEHKDSDSLLIISYEKLKANNRNEILRIAKFLGDEYHRMLSDDEEMLGKVMEHTSFDYMKKNLSMKHPSAIVSNMASEKSSQETVNFFRKGVVGEGKKSLTSAQMERLRKTATEKLKDHNDVVKEWFEN